MVEPVADVLTRVAEANRAIGRLVVELLNQPDDAQRAARLRELGQHLGSATACSWPRPREAMARCTAPSATLSLLAAREKRRARPDVWDQTSARFSPATRRVNTHSCPRRTPASTTVG